MTEVLLTKYVVKNDPRLGPSSPVLNGTNYWCINVFILMCTDLSLLHNTVSNNTENEDHFLISQKPSLSEGRH